MFKLLQYINCNNKLLLSKTNCYQSIFRLRKNDLTNLIQKELNGFNKNVLKVDRNCKVKQISKNKTIGERLRLFNLLLGGSSGILLGVTYNRHKYLTNCQSDRLTGYEKKTYENDVKFDWKTFWLYLKPHLLKFIGAILAALAVAYFNIKIPELLGIFVNSLSKYAKIGGGGGGGGSSETFNANTFLHDMKRPAANLFGMYILQSCFTFFYILLLSKIGERMAASIRQDLFHKIIIQDLSFFDRNRTGELVNRLTADVQDFKSSFKQCVSQGLRSVAQLIGGSISLYLISPQMAVIALISVPVAVCVMSMLGGTLRALSKRSQAQTEKATTVCEEALSNIRTVRSSACEFYEIEMFERETNRAAELAQRLGIGIAVFQALTNLFLNGMVLCTLFVGGQMMANDNLSPGQLMAFLVASQGVQRSLAQGSILLGSMIRGMTAGTRVFEYLKIKPEVDLIDGIKIPDDQLKGCIEFKNVTFAYPTRPDQIVLKNFNLILEPGQTVALVGASGSGKSTIAGLLERFYEPLDGEITIDGHNLNEISPIWLRGSVIGFIEQQPILFATSILENIRYGQKSATIQEIFEVAKQSQCHEFINGLSNGYETNVGERGHQLSGGQRQRIAIARALLKQPIILILDEATSALDATSEAIVQKALDTAVINRTTLVIAHRLSTIRNADVIVVLDQGRISEMGTHETLMKQKGIYFNLVRQQEKQEKDQEVPSSSSSASSNQQRSQG